MTRPRHRLSRAGNRRLNHVLHIAAIVQIRHDTEGRAYYRRKLAELLAASLAARHTRNDAPMPVPSNQQNAAR